MVRRGERRNAVLGVAAVGVVAVLGAMLMGGPRINGTECSSVAEPTAVKDVAPDARIVLSSASPLSLTYGHNRGVLEDETELQMKAPGADVELPAGPIALSHSLLKRSSGSTSSISGDAVTLWAVASGRTVRVRMCVDTRKDPGIAAGRYLATVSIDDGRFEPHEGIPMEVALQSANLWRFGVPLAAVVLWLSVLLAGIAADQRLRAIDVTVVPFLTLLVVGATAQAFYANGVTDPSFGHDPLVQWIALAWAVGSSGMAAATSVFGGERGLQRMRTSEAAEPPQASTVPQDRDAAPRSVAPSVR